MPSAISLLATLPEIASDTQIKMNGGIGYVEVPYSGNPNTVFDPSKIVLTVADPGFLPGGGTTTVNRTIRGRKILRRHAPDQATLWAVNDNGTYKVHFSLEEPIYLGSTITGATAEPGFYGTAEAGDITNRSQLSSRPYLKPLSAWLNLQFERAPGDTFAAELFASHIHGRNGQMVARVEFTAKDPAGAVSPTVTVASPNLSILQTQGQKAEVFRATIPTGNLAQGGGCKVNAKIFPWIGDASAILDLEVDGPTWPTTCPQTQLIFYNDKDGSYGGAIAAVKSGAVGGAVQVTRELARTTPFPTINAALAAIPSWNNTNRGHNDLGGGEVIVMDNNGANWTTSNTANVTVAAGACWCVVRPDPANTAQVFYDAFTNTRTLPSLIDWRINTIYSAVASGSATVFLIAGYTTTGSTMFAANDMSVVCNQASTRPWVYRPNFLFQRNVIFSGTGLDGRQVGLASADYSHCVLGLGVVSPTNILVGSSPYALVGCVGNVRLAPTAAAQGSNDGAIIYNNKMSNLGASFHDFNGRTWARGLHIIQNQLETLSTEAVLNVGGDNSVPNLDNVLIAYNTAVGNRFNHAYTSATAQAGSLKWAVTRFNIFTAFNVKPDTYDSTVANRAGNWMTRYHVGNLGNVVLEGDSNGTGPDIPGPIAWIGETWPEASGWQVGRAAVPFADYEARDPAAGTLGSGNGDYRLTGETNAAYGKVPVGLHMLSYDLAGNPRRGATGPGAAGAYESTQNAGISGSGGGSVGSFGSSGSGRVAVRGAGGGAFGVVSAQGAGGLTGATGSGGGSIGMIGGSGTGEVSSSGPITETGPIIAIPERTARFEPVPPGPGGGPELPVHAVNWGAPFDPADRTPYAMDWSLLLAVDEGIAQIDHILISPQGLTLGLQVDSDAGRSPIISEDRKRTQVWLLCDQAFLLDPAFAGQGVQVGITLRVRTSAAPFKVYERTAIVAVRQQ